MALWSQRLFPRLSFISCLGWPLLHMHFKCRVPFTLKPDELDKCWCSRRLTSESGSVPREQQGRIGKDSSKITQPMSKPKRFIPRLLHSNCGISIPPEGKTCLFDFTSVFHSKVKNRDTRFTFVTSQYLPSWVSLSTKNRIYSVSQNSGPVAVPWRMLPLSRSGSL